MECGPKSTAEAPEISCFPYAEEGTAISKPSDISALGKAYCRKLVLVIGSKANWCKWTSSYRIHGKLSFLKNSWICPGIQTTLFQGENAECKEDSSSQVLCQETQVVILFRVLARRILFASYYVFFPWERGNASDIAGKVISLGSKQKACLRPRWFHHGKITGFLAGPEHWHYISVCALPLIICMDFLNYIKLRDQILCL